MDLISAYDSDDEEQPKSNADDAVADAESSGDQTNQGQGKRKHSDVDSDDVPRETQAIVVQTSNPEWVACWDANVGQYYYYNLSNQLVTWEKPDVELLIPTESSNADEKPSDSAPENESVNKEETETVPNTSEEVQESPSKENTESTPATDPTAATAVDWSQNPEMYYYYYYQQYLAGATSNPSSIFPPPPPPPSTANDSNPTDANQDKKPNSALDNKPLSDVAASIVSTQTDSSQADWYQQQQNFQQLSTEHQQYLWYQWYQWQQQQQQQQDLPEANASSADSPPSSSSQPQDLSLAIEASYAAINSSNKAAEPASDEPPTSPEVGVRVVQREDEPFAEYYVRALFNSRTNRMQGFRKDVSSEARAMRQMGAFFDVEAWQKKVKEGKEEKQPKVRLSHQEIEQLKKEKKQKRSKKQNAWLFED